MQFERVVADVKAECAVMRCLAVAVALAACGPHHSHEVPDAATPDAATPDATTPDAVTPDAAIDAVPPTVYEILHVRWNDGPELVVGTRDGKVLPLRKLGGGVVGAGQTALSPDGTLLAFSSFDGEGLGWALIVRPLEGADSDEQVFAHTTASAQPAWSPDGRQLAYVSFTGDTLGVYVLSVKDGVPKLLDTVSAGPDASRCISPQWSPDGTEVAFSTIDGIASYDLAAEQTRHLVAGAFWACEPKWSPDGATLAFAQGEGVEPGHIMKIQRTGGAVTPVAEMVGGIRTGQVAWSPDGSQLAYVTFESGAVLRIVGSNGGETRLLDTLHAGIVAGHPHFSPDGKQVLYVRFQDGARLTTVASSGGTPEDLHLEGAAIDGSYPLWLAHPIVR